MALSRRTRVLAAFLAAFGLLLSQLAVAAHGCMGEEAMAMAAVDGEQAPCCGGDTPEAEPALCAAHCQQGDRSLDKPAAPAVPALLALDSVRIEPATGPPDGVPRATPASLLERTTAPPLTVRHCRFQL